MVSFPASVLVPVPVATSSALLGPVSPEPLMVLLGITAGYGTGGVPGCSAPTLTWSCRIWDQVGPFAYGVGTVVLNGIAAPTMSTPFHDRD